MTGVVIREPSQRRVLWFTAGPPRAVRERLGGLAVEGPAAWVDGLLDALSRDERADGLDVAVAAASTRPFAAFTHDGVAYHCVHRVQPASAVMRVIRGWGHDVGTREAMAAALDIVSSVAPDIVHVHGTENPFGLLAGAIGTPVVISLQGLLSACCKAYFRGVGGRDFAGMAVSLDTLKGRGELHGYLEMRRRAQREQAILRRARHVAGRTSWDRKMAAAVNPRAVYHHCDEIMRPDFYDTEWRSRGASSTGATVFTTSSSMLFKGTESLIAAVALLHRRGYEHLQLRVAGVPPGEQVATFYREVARRAGVADAITWLGRIDAARLVDELLSADLFAYPSHVDNSPNSLCEAMLVGAPVIATRVGGIPSIVDHGVNGLLASDGPEALADSIDTVLRDRDLAARLGAAARLTALGRHDPELVVGQVLDTYRVVQGDRCGGRA